MKKQITAFIFIFLPCSFMHGQTFVKTTTPGNEEMLKKTSGRDR